VLAVVPMAIALAVIPLPMNWIGLLSAIALGSALYIVSALVLDVGGMRSIGLSAVRARVRTRIPALTD
jgi:hypothetical protein